MPNPLSIGIRKNVLKFVRTSKNMCTLFLGLYQPLRTLATGTKNKHFSYKVVEDVAVISMDSPGVKVGFCLLSYMNRKNSYSVISFT